MNEKKGKILVVDDDPDILLTIRVILKKQFETIITESDPQLLTGHIKGVDAGAQESHIERIPLDAEPILGRVDQGHALPIVLGEVGPA